jgi:Holliday junction resolvase RusA-like endonuclease
MRFEFVIPGIPRTPQTKSSKSREDWRRRVRSAASAARPAARPPITTESSAVIVYFYNESTNIDVDGIAKLIFDAIEETVIENDKLVSQVLLRKTDRKGLIVSNPPALLLDALEAHTSFVYVSLDDAPDHKEVPK